MKRGFQNDHIGFMKHSFLGYAPHPLLGFLPSIKQRAAKTISLATSLFQKQPQTSKVDQHRI